MTFKMFKPYIIVENTIDYLVQGIILTLAMFIIPSFRTLHNDMALYKFAYIVIIFTCVLIIIDRVIPDIGKTFRSITGLGLYATSNVANI